MKCRALRTFLHDQLGRVEKGAILHGVTAAQFRSVQAFRWLEELPEELPEDPGTYDTKVVEEKPKRSRKSKP